MYDDLLRCALLDDIAAVHEDDTVSDLTGEADLMGDDDHRHAVCRQLLHDGQYLADHLRIEGRGRLIEEHDVRLHAERTRDRDTLLLPTGKLRRIGLRLLRQIDTLKHLHRALLRLRLTALPELHRCQHQIMQDIHIIEEIEMLEHHADVLADLIHIHLFIGDVDPIHLDLSGRHILELVQAAKKGRLTGAGRAEDDDDLALMDLGRDVP